MNVRRPSGSKIGMFLECRGPAILPWKDEGPSAVAEKGTRIHGALERFYMGARTADIRHMVRGDDCCLEDVINAAPTVAPEPDLPFVEVECWYDPVARRAEIGIPGDRSPEGYWRGRTDLIGRNKQTGNLCVVDHKTGNPFFQTPPRSSAQVAYFAVWLLARLKRYEEVDGGVYVTQKGETLWHTWHPEELAEWADTFEELELDLRAYETGAKTLDDLVFNPSKRTCKWCPARDCPARVR